MAAEAATVLAAAVLGGCLGVESTWTLGPPTAREVSCWGWSAWRTSRGWYSGSVRAAAECCSRSLPIVWDGRE